MFMVRRSWSHQCGSVYVDRAGKFRHDSFDISSIPMNKNDGTHVEHMKVLSST